MSRQCLIMTKGKDSTTSLGNLCQCSVNLMIKSIFSSCSEETWNRGILCWIEKISSQFFPGMMPGIKPQMCLLPWMFGELAHGWTWSPSPDMSCSPFWATGELCPSVMLSSELPLPICHWILLPHLSAEWHRVITKGCGTFRIEKSQILTQWRNQGEPRLSSGQQTALYGYYKAAGNEWPGEKQHTVRTDKKKRWEREEEWKRRKKDAQHLNRNKRNVSRQSWMKGHAELWAHTRKPRATEDMQMEKTTAMWHIGAF